MKIDINVDNFRFDGNAALANILTIYQPLESLTANDYKKILAETGEKLAKLQNRLHASGKLGILVVLQGMDTSGKDGVIRHVFRFFNPLGVRTEPFSAPTQNELSHDYLWRIHQKLPARGELVIFNRSHYEDVLVTKVRGIITSSHCQRRYRHIHDFEAMLSDENIVIMKFFLHISKDQQKQRLQERLNDPDKLWKLQASDFEDRKHWDDFQMAYQDAMAATNEDYAPWYIIPADVKTQRDIIIAKIVAKTMEKLDLSLPKAQFDPSRLHWS